MSKRRAMQEIVEEVGWSAAERIMRRFGGDRIYIPKLTSAIITRRNAQLITDYDNGMTYEELSEKYGVSESHARLIVSRRDVTPMNLADH